MIYIPTKITNVLQTSLDFTSEPQSISYLLCPDISHFPVPAAMVRTLLLLLVVMTVLAVTWANPNPAPVDGNGFQPFRVGEDSPTDPAGIISYSDLESIPQRAPTRYSYP